MRFRAVMILAAVLLGLPGRASAAPIGTFTWVYDSFFGTGSSFSVANESTNSFDAIFVDLYAAGSANPFQSLDFGTILGLEVAQSLEDLSLLTIPVDLDRAHLRFTFGTDTVGIDLFSAALTGDPTDFLASSVEISIPDAPPPEPVPEPGTLLLLGVGVVAMGLRRLRRRPASCEGISPQPDRT